MHTDVRAIRGGDSNDVSREVGVAPGQNSIASPNAIGEMVETESKDSGAVIREANEQRKEEISFRVSDWEAEVIAEMKHRSITADEGVHRVESMQSQKHSPIAGPGNISMADTIEVPDKTLGETIGDRNESRRQEIQRDASDGRSDWDKSESSVKTKVSDSFFASLKKNLGKG